MKKTLNTTLALFVIFLLLLQPLSAKEPVRKGTEKGAGDLYQEYLPTLTSGDEKSTVELPNFASLVKFAQGAVVNIASETASDDGKEKKEDGADELPPFLRRGPQRPARSLGSGFFINKDGYIVTNNHVVEKSSSIIVRIPEDKNEYEAKLIGADPKTDLALIKIEPRGAIVSLPLGDSEKLEVGEWVIAIGNQFQLGQTFTAGIVSAKARKVPTASSGPYDQFIQTDASINPGSSGGPLLNSRGQVIGINTAIFSPGRQRFGGGSGFNIGIGFSVPINLAKGIIVQLKKNGRVTRGLLGVIIQAVTIDVKEALGLPAARGALVADVLEDTPAFETGFQREDVIVGYNGKKIDDHDDLPLMVANTPVGNTAKVLVLRDGKEVVLTPKIGKLTDRPKDKKKDEDPEPDKIGLIVEEMTTQYAKSLGLAAPNGIVISHVESGSAGEKAGFARGDVIEELNRKVIRGVADYERILKGLAPKKAVLVLLRRKEGTRFLTLKPE